MFCEPIDRINYAAEAVAMGSRRLDSLTDVSSARFKLRADCLACKRVVILEPIPLKLLCHDRGWSLRLEAVQARMVCAECGSRNVRLGPAFRE